MAPRPPTTTVVTASIVRPDFGAAYWTPEKPRRAFAPSLKSLPFVKMKGGGRRARVASYWTDAPTGNGRADFKRGRKYAALTIAAMTADGCAPWYLERIIEAILIDAGLRKAKGGKYSRTLPPAVEGFIHELSCRFCARITGSQL